MFIFLQVKSKKYKWYIISTTVESKENNNKTVWETQED